MTRRRGGGGGVLLWISFLIVIAAVLFAWLNRDDAVEEQPPVMVPVEEEGLPMIRHPLPEPTPGAEDEEGAEEVLPEHLPGEMPALDDSDDAVVRIAEYLIANPRLIELLASEDLIRRIVVTVENLPHPDLPPTALPAQAPGGRFLVEREGEEEIVLDARNYGRYERHVALLDALDSGELVRAYVHLYPLFEEAYRDLGFPSAHFNDRLVDVIDHLLEAPAVHDPIALAQPSVVYLYADPQIESLSAGQKLLVRMGTDNAAVVKGRLREIREALVRREDRP